MVFCGKIGYLIYKLGGQSRKNGVFYQNRREEFLTQKNDVQVSQEANPVRMNMNDRENRERYLHGLDH
jgi:hypothetical protein